MKQKLIFYKSVRLYGLYSVALSALFIPAYMLSSEGGFGELSFPDFDVFASFRRSTDWRHTSRGSALSRSSSNSATRDNLYTRGNNSRGPVITLEEIQERLYSAARNNARQTAREALAQGADINKPDEQGDTPFDLAMIYGGADITRYLISRGALNTLGSNPIHEIIKKQIKFAQQSANKPNKKQAHALEIMLGQLKNKLKSKIVDINDLDNKGQTPLHRAVLSEASEHIKVLLKYQADIDQLNGNGQSPLHEAVFVASAPLTELLIAQGAQVTTENKWGDTALARALFLRAMALEKGAEHEEYNACIALLLKKRAPYIKGVLESTPQAACHAQLLLEALENQDLELVTIIIEHGDWVNKETAEIRDALKNIDFNDDINVRDSSGNTPLHDAIIKAQKNTVRLFLTYGADATAATVNGQTPLGLVLALHATADGELRKNYNLIARILAQALAKHTKCPLCAPFSCDQKTTSLHKAINDADTQLVKIILGQGKWQDWDTNDKHGGLMHFALSRLILLHNRKDLKYEPQEAEELAHQIEKLHEIVRLLVEYKAKLSYIHLLNGSLLSRAAHAGLLELVKLFLKHTPDHLNQPDFNGYTPLEKARRNGHEAVAKFLEIAALVYSDLVSEQSSWLDQETKEIRGALDALKTNTPSELLHDAIVKGHDQAVILLLAHGADIKQVYTDGQTPVQLALSLHAEATGDMRENYNETVSVLLKAETAHDRSQGITTTHNNLLREALRASDVERTELLLEDGNWQEDEQESLLHEAFDVLAELNAHITSAALSDVQASESSTALEQYQQAPLPERLKNVLRELKETCDKVCGQISQLDETIDGNKQRTEEIIQIIKLLITYKARVNLVDAQNRTVLERAVDYQYPELVELLIAHSDRELINRQDEFGQTPLHRAVETQNARIVSILMDQGADATARTFLGVTPYKYATNQIKKTIYHNLEHHTNNNSRKVPCIFCQCNNARSTSLHDAIYQADDELAEFILNQNRWQEWDIHDCHHGFLYYALSRYIQLGAKHYHLLKDKANSQEEVMHAEVLAADKEKLHKIIQLLLLHGANTTLKDLKKAAAPFIEKSHVFYDMLKLVEKYRNSQK